MTQLLVRDLKETVLIVSANAQRTNSEVKINNSIVYVLHLVEALQSLTSVYDRLGMKRNGYWKGLVRAEGEGAFEGILREKHWSFWGRGLQFVIALCWDLGPFSRHTPALLRAARKM
ncbi:hypothetical protein C8R44DRAFT_727259 [Mycena epipterygia]|nr:hypothetical protein C8R44DRAFT_727259 [Mycena epipterygia]